MPPMDRALSKMPPAREPGTPVPRGHGSVGLSRAEALAEVCAAIDQADLTETAIASATAVRTAEVLGDSCAILLRPAGGGPLRLVAAADTDPEAVHFMRALPGLVPSVGDGPTLLTRVLESGRSVRIPRASPDDMRPSVRPDLWAALNRYGPRSLLLAPVKTNGQPIGVLYLSRRGTAAVPYSEDDELLALTIAQRIGHALARASFVAELQERNRRLELENRELRHAAGRSAMERVAVSREAGAFFEDLVAAGPFIVWRASAGDLSVSYISPSTERVLGYAPDEVFQTPGFWKAHMHPADYERFRAVVSDAVTEGERQFTDEYRMLHKDGTYHWIYTLVTLERDQRGAVESLLGLGLDITNRKEIEAALEQARLDAERANLAKSEFLSRMSHELRTPLNAVLGFAQLLEMDPLSPEQRENLGYILKAGRHLLDLINEVLDIARIEAGRMSVSPESVGLGEIAEEVLALTAPLAAERAVRLRPEMADAEAHRVLADRQRLKQVLLNLLSNAVKYNKVGGEVILSYRTQDDRVRIQVTDTGPGIPSDKQERLFIPFERLGTAGGGVEGTGLGLALSKRLTEVMGGTIGVDSEVGRGSTFWIELPLAEPAAQPADRPADVAQARAVRGLTETTYAVLYVEDNLAHLDLIERVLARRPGVKLMSAMQGRMGLTLAREHVPDLILLDVHLPDIPGGEVLHRLQADLKTRRIPVVVLSSDPSPEQAERLLASGAHACLAKPIDVRELMKILDGVLRLRID